MSISKKFKDKNLAPLMVRFGLSTWCNYNCSMCCWVHSPYRDNWIPLENLDYEVLINTLHYLYNNGTEVILFSWVWEPFNHPKIYDILKFVSDKFIIYIQTNISLINERKFNDLDFTQKIWVSVNFNAVSEKAYKYIYSNQPYWNLAKIIIKIHYLKRQWVEIKLIFIISKLNFFDVEAVIELTQKLDIILHLEFSNELNWIEWKITLNQEQKIDIMNKVRKRLLGNNFLQNNLNHEEFFEQVKWNKSWVARIKRCNAWYMYARIEESGDVYPCNNTRKSFLKWNLYQNSFQEIWASYDDFKENVYKWEFEISCCSNNAATNWGNYKLRMFLDDSFT